MSQELKSLADEFNRYFASENGVDVGERVTVSRDEWRTLYAALARTQQTEQAAQHEQAAKVSLREAAQNALVTLDGIADTSPRDKSDFETPNEWIAWAKSRARWAADKLRNPLARELHAERIIKQMLDEPQPEQVVPEGFVLVPVAPTESMVVNGMEADVLGRPSVDDSRHVLSIWTAMLAASGAKGE